MKVMNGSDNGPGDNLTFLVRTNRRVGFTKYNLKGRDTESTEQFDH